MNDRLRSLIPSALCLIGAVACLVWVAMGTASGVGSPADVTPPTRLPAGAAPRMSGAVRHPKEADARSSFRPGSSDGAVAREKTAQEDDGWRNAGSTPAPDTSYRLPIPPQFQPTIEGLRGLVPIQAWPEFLSEKWHGTFPVDDDLVRAYEDPDVRSVLYTTLRAEIALGVLEQLGEDPVAVVEAARVYAAARSELMREMERANGYAHFRELDELFQLAIDGDD